MMVVSSCKWSYSYCCLFLAISISTCLLAGFFSDDLLAGKIEYFTLQFRKKLYDA
jgi:hypothetical protein